MMKIIFVGGGTAGHVNPALSVAKFLQKKEPDAQILFVGAKGGIEERLVKEENFDFLEVDATGFYRKLNIESIKKNFITLKNILLSGVQSVKILKKFKPDICMGTGGYVCGQFLRKAGKLKVPYIIHEQNAYPGMTTRLLVKKASKIMLATDAAREFLDPRLDIVTTGNPVRSDINKISQEEAKKILGFDDKSVILSFGGSLGADTINKCMVGLIKYNNEFKTYNIIHAYGKLGKWFPDRLKSEGIDFEHDKRYYIKQYIKNMPICMAAADLVICRAGAMTISEVCMQGKPALFIPSPNVSENHQYYNAIALSRKNAAEILLEREIKNNDYFVGIVVNLIDDKEKMKKFSENIKQFAVLNADEKIYEIIKDQIELSKHKKDL